MTATASPFRPLTIEQRAALMRHIDTIELAQLRAEQQSDRLIATPPTTSEGTASALRLQDAMRTGRLRLVPMGEPVIGNAAPRRVESMTDDRYLLNDGIPVLREALAYQRVDHAPISPATPCANENDLADEDEWNSGNELTAPALIIIAAWIAIVWALYLGLPSVFGLLSRVFGG